MEVFTIDITLNLLLPLVVLTHRAIQTQLEPGNPTKLPNADLIPAQTEGPIGQQRVSIFKNQHRRVEWWVCFSKFDEILAKSG